MENTRRSFIKKMTAVGLGTTGLAAMGTTANAEVTKTTTKQRTVGKDAGKLRFGFIGTGSRCHEHINNVLSIGENKIVAICDIQQGPIERTLKHIAKFNVTAPKVYTGSDHAFEKMLNNEEFDCIIIASPWEWHTYMAVAAMKAGVPYVGVEVSAANCLQECWDLVNVSESTGSHLQIMENVCYRRDVMAVMNMTRAGLFGELLHARCGYEHDLRSIKFNDGTSYSYEEGHELKMGKEAYAEAQWRTNHSVHRNGDLYPTHGTGPVAECLDINKGNRFMSISSMATQSRGLHKFVEDHGGADHPLAKVHFNCGDIVVSQIHCANGQTILVTHDTNAPRPYSLNFRIQGTEGLWMKDGDHMYIEGKSKPHRWDNSQKWLDQYDHKLWRDLGEKASAAGHGGMDYIMMADLLHAIRDGRPTPIDCYDAAAWSAISGLSEQSVARGGALVDFPDFTRGQWINRKNEFGTF
ncbi:MAG: Gfo/Idh/MocA family oxidoreductase [Massilibacteroides sp.]|nr:Gfo/Idh/MocA family oxidoreductase [Massilibacteroides sp.]